jgi:hypothetical protein
MATVISRTEFERIRASVAATSDADIRRNNKRETLKKLSEEKKSKWPNTLEAIRKKTESFLKEREEQAELRRQEIDREVCLIYTDYFSRMQSLTVIIFRHFI